MPSRPPRTRSLARATLITATLIAAPVAAVAGCGRPGAGGPGGPGALPRATAASARAGAGSPWPAGSSATGSAPASAPPSRVPIPAPSSRPGDGPPDQADNGAWRQRQGPTAADGRAAAAAAARIRPALEHLRAAGLFGPDATLGALVALGFAVPDVQVEPMRQPPGTAYAVHVGRTGCVIGDLRPQRVLAQVAGVAAEFGCLEPDTH
jgi:hypothetical protein